MEDDEQEQVVTEQLQALALQDLEGLASGLMIAGEYLGHLLQNEEATTIERQRAMSSLLARFALYSGRNIMRSLGAFD
ncbi:hypothetical protein S922_09060 [Salmonella enterica subsp. enterica]|nr:hypothetical protein [Salmonella enterica subsp. enterica]EAW9771293.1 hypothetical protein [Salmonella enterica]